MDYYVQSNGSETPWTKEQLAQIIQEYELHKRLNSTGDYFKAGDSKQGELASIPGSLWFQMITEELRNLVEFAGLNSENSNLSPDVNSWSQVSDAVSELVKREIKSALPPDSTILSRAFGTTASTSVDNAVFNVHGSTIMLSVDQIDYANRYRVDCRLIRPALKWDFIDKYTVIKTVKITVGNSGSEYGYRGTFGNLDADYSDLPADIFDNDDIELINVGSHNTSPRGIWADGSNGTIWVADSGTDKKLYAYRLTNREFYPDTANKTLTLDSVNANPEGIWSDEITMWVADSTDNTLYAYTISSGSRDSSEDISLDSANTNPAGIWSDDTTIWVVDSADAKLYAYVLSSHARDTTKDVGNLAMDNQHPYGIWGDSSGIWISDTVSKKIFAYTFRLSTSVGSSISSREISLVNSGADTNTDAYGIWSDGTLLWVLDSADTKLYAYNLLHGTHESTNDIDLTSVNANPTSIASNGEILWVLDTDDTMLYAYDLTDNGAYISSKNIDLDAANGTPKAIWCDDSLMYVFDSTFLGVNLYAYNISSTGTFGAYVSASDVSITLHSDHTVPNTVDMWGDGTILWILDTSDKKAYAYKLSDGTNISGSTITLAGTPSSPKGIWSDGVNVWVSDSGDNKVYVYANSEVDRNESDDIILDHSDDVISPTGIWSDGTTLWVADSNLAVLYGYNLADGTYITSASDQSISELYGTSTGNILTINYASGFLKPISELENYYLRITNFGDKELALINLGARETDVEIEDRTNRTIYKLTSPRLSRLFINANGETLNFEICTLSTQQRFTVDTDALTEFGLEPDDLYYKWYRNSILVLESDKSTTNKILNNSYDIDDSINRLISDDEIHCIIGYGDSDRAGNLSSYGNNFSGVSEFIKTDSYVHDRTHSYQFLGKIVIKTGKHPLIDDYGYVGSYLSSVHYGSIDTSYSYLPAELFVNKTTPFERKIHNVSSDNDNSGISIGWESSQLLKDDLSNYWVRILSDNGSELVIFNMAGAGYEGTSPVTGAGIYEWFNLGKVDGVFKNNSEVTLEFYYNLPSKQILSRINITAGKVDDKLGYDADDGLGSLDPLYSSLPGVLFTDNSTKKVTDIYYDSSNSLFTINVNNGTFKSIDNLKNYVFRIYDADFNVILDSFNMGGYKEKDSSGDLLTNAPNINTYSYSYVLSRLESRLSYLEDGANLYFEVIEVPNYEVSIGSVRFKAGSSSGKIGYVGKRGALAGFGELLKAPKIYSYITAGDSANSLINGSYNLSEPTTDVTVTELFGLYDDGEHLWVVDTDTNYVRAYLTGTGTYEDGRSIDLTAITDNIKDIGSASDSSDIIWISSTGSELNAYNKTTGASDADNDFTLATNNSRPTYITSDGETLWVADSGTSSLIYAYALSIYAEDYDSGFDLDSGNSDPQNLWTDGTTTYVLDITGTKVYAYKVSDGQRDSGKDIDLNSGNADPKGIWSNGTTLWVGDATNNRLYAYTVSSGSYSSSDDIDLDSDNTNPVSIWSYSSASYIWVLDSTDNKMYAYATSDGSYNSTNSFTIGPETDAILTGISGIAEDKLWVSDNNADYKRLRAYSHITASSSFDKQGTPLDLISTSNPRGLWSDGNYWYITNYGSDLTNTLLVYDRSTGSRDNSLEISLSAIPGNNTGGNWSDGETIWIARWSATDEERKLIAFDLEGREHDSSKDIVLDATNTAPMGIWSNRTTIWVSDNLSRKVYAYVLANGARDSANDIPRSGTLSGSDSPADIWSDGTTMWISVGSNGLLAYNLSDGAADTSKNITSSMLSGSSSGQNDVEAVWSDGFHIWLVDTTNTNQIYKYTMLSGTRIAEHDIDVSDHSNINGCFVFEDSTVTPDTAEATKKLFTVDGGSGTDKVRSYFLESNVRDRAKEITLETDNSNPAGIHYDGTDILVLNNNDDSSVSIFAYYANGSYLGTHHSDNDISLAYFDGEAHGLAGSDDKLWIASYSPVLQYTVPSELFASGSSRVSRILHEFTNESSGSVGLRLSASSAIFKSAQELRNYWIMIENLTQDRSLSFDLSGYSIAVDPTIASEDYQIDMESLDGFMEVDDEIEISFIRVVPNENLSLGAIIVDIKGNTLNTSDTNNVLPPSLFSSPVSSDARTVPTDGITLDNNFSLSWDDASILHNIRDLFNYWLHIYRTRDTIQTNFAFVNLAGIGDNNSPLLSRDSDANTLTWYDPSRISTSDLFKVNESEGFINLETDDKIKLEFLRHSLGSLQSGEVGGLDIQTTYYTSSFNPKIALSYSGNQSYYEHFNRIPNGAIVEFKVTPDNYNSMAGTNNASHVARIVTKTSDPILPTRIKILPRSMNEEQRPSGTTIEPYNDIQMVLTSTKIKEDSDFEYDPDDLISYLEEKHDLVDLAIEYPGPLLEIGSGVLYVHWYYNAYYIERYFYGDDDTTYDAGDLAQVGSGVEIELYETGNDSILATYRISNYRAISSDDTNGWSQGMVIPNLVNGLTYDLVFKLYDASGDCTVPGEEYRVTSPVISILSEPRAPFNIDSIVKATSIEISWVNPIDADFAAIKIEYDLGIKSGSFITTTTEWVFNYSAEDKVTAGAVTDVDSWYINLKSINDYAIESASVMAWPRVPGTVPTLTNTVNSLSWGDNDSAGGEKQDDGGATIIGYDLQYRTSATDSSVAGDWTELNTGSDIIDSQSLSYSVLKDTYSLTTGTTYDFRVRAINRAGESKYWRLLKTIQIV